MFKTETIKGYNELTGENKKLLEELCKPVADYLKNNCDPYCTIIITDSEIRLVEDKVGIPVGSDD